VGKAGFSSPVDVRLLWTTLDQKDAEADVGATIGASSPRAGDPGNACREQMH